MLSSSNIRRWLNSTSEAALNSGTGVEPGQQAKTIWESAIRGSAVGPLLTQAVVRSGQDAIPELAMAFTELLKESSAYAGQALSVGGDIWEWFAAAPWPINEFDEQNTLLAGIAYLLAARYRDAEDYRPMRFWEDKCSGFLREIEPSRTYLAVFGSQSSKTVEERVLQEPALLLAVCRQVEILRNIRPASALRRAARAFTLVRNGLDPCDQAGSLAYFAGDLAMSAAISASHLKLGEAAAWGQAAEYYFDVDPKCRWLAPIARTVRISILSNTTALDPLLREAPSVAHEVEAMGADLAHMSVQLCAAQALRNLSQHAEAARILESLIARYPDGDPLRLGTAHAQLADTKLEMGDLNGAVLECQRAYPLLREGDGVVSLSYLQAVVSQLYRVTGRTKDAILALRESAESYADGGFRSWAAHNRILTAEALLQAERAPEALEELLSALVLLEGSEAELELWAAVKLLRAVLLVAQPTHAQLRGCREELENIRRGHWA